MKKLSILHKIGFITVNLLFWIVVLWIGDYFTWERPPFSTEDGTFRLTMLSGNFFNAVVVYVNALLLYPFRKRIWLPYWLTVLLLILSTAGIEAFIDVRIAEHLGLLGSIEQVFEEAPEGTAIYFVMFAWIIQNIFIHFGWFCLSFIIIFFFNSVKSKQIQEALEKEKLTTELRYLKAQINPHFLFNGINSIYFLIDDKPEIAKSTLLKFSDLLRYQLYECQDNFIALKRELAHVASYIEMEKIRRGEDATIQLNLPEVVGAEQISPLLFTPFLENAFKYLSNHDEGEKNRVFIEFRLQEGQLFFEIENTVDQTPYKQQKEGGIGIKNVKKRLALLYPKRHQLDIFKREDRFIVRLNLQL